MPCRRSNFRKPSHFVLIASLLAFFSSQASAALVARATTKEIRARIEAVLTSMMTADSPARESLATIWDGNAYIQCREATGGGVRCEAAGALMQSSLEFVLTPERVHRLYALGWELDSSFGNYVQTFPSNMKTQEISEILLTSLKEGYGTNPADFEFENAAVAREACPPRDGPSQNLAGAINNAKEMASVLIHTCTYTPPSPDFVLLKMPIVSHDTATALIASHQARVIKEIKRLRENSGHKWVFMALQTGVGYVQCESTQTVQAIDCEAQSAESEPSLARVLAPKRVVSLHRLGYAPPGLKQNYYRGYEATESDTTIADALLTILHDVYGYEGATKLKVYTETGEHDLP